MACRAFAATALLLLLSPAAAVQRRLQAHAGSRAAARSRGRRLQQVLRSRTAQLKRALWDEFGLAPAQPFTAELADAARALLSREADYLTAEDGDAAALLRDYAGSGLVPVLAMDFEPPATRELPGEFSAPVRAHRIGSDSRELRTVESSETIVQMDALGNRVRTVRQCRGRTCVTTEDLEPMEPEEPEIVEVFGGIPAEGRDSEELQVARAMQEAFGGRPTEAEEEEEEGPEEAQARDVEELEGAVGDTVESAADAVGSAVRVAARGMARDLKRVMKGSGLPPLGQIMGKLMNSTAAKGIAGALSTGNFSGARFNASLTGEGLAKALQDLVGSAGLANASGVFAPLANAESVSTVTTVENGHVVRHVRRCKQGQCTSTTEEGEATDGPEDAQAQHTEELEAVDDTVESAADAAGSTVGVAARGMARDLKQVMKGSGLPPLGQIMGKLMNSTVAKGIAGALSTGNFSGARFNASFTGEGLAKAFQGLVGSAGANAESVSTVTTVEDGHVVRHVRRCKQGQCTSTTEEGEAADGPED